MLSAAKCKVLNKSISCNCNGFKQHPSSMHRPKAGHKHSSTDASHVESQIHYFFVKDLVIYHTTVEIK